MKNLPNVSHAAILTVLLAAVTFAEASDVSFNAADGFALKGTFYSSGKVGPGILMLHQCSADRQLYNQLGTMLSAAGYNVLSFDYRGFGSSKAGEYTNYDSQRQKITEKMPGDVDAGLNFLNSQPNVNKTVTGVVAGSCSVNQAIKAGQRHPEIKTFVLLSGGNSVDANGEAYIRNSPRIPFFGAASEEDTEAAASIRKLVGLSANKDSQLSMFKDAGHAASMFEKQPDLQADIVIWFRSNLPVGGYGLTPQLR
jgi:dienelactone hydrolase